MITHIVVFRTKSSLDNQTLLNAAKQLGDIKLDGFDGFVCGAPHISERPVVDDTFAAAIVVTVRDKAALDAYMVHPIHVDFSENCLKKLKVKVDIFEIES